MKKLPLTLFSPAPLIFGAAIGMVIMLLFPPNADEINQLKEFRLHAASYVFLDSVVTRESDSTTTEYFCTYVKEQGKLTKYPFMTVTRNSIEMQEDLSAIKTSREKESSGKDDKQ